MSADNRNKHIDTCKGMGILFVVFGHNWILFNKIGEPYNILGSFRMALFFFVSGIFFKPALGFMQTITSKFDSLLKPYFVSAVAVSIFDVIYDGDSIIMEFFSVLYGNGNRLHWYALWFLPHLFTVTIFSWGFTNFLKVTPKNDYFKYILMFGVLAFGVTFIDVFWDKQLPILGNSYTMVGLPFSLDIVPVSGFYFLLGHFLKDRIIRFKLNFTFAFLALSLFVALHYFFDITMDLNMRKYDQIVLTTIEAMCGIYLILSVSYALQSFDFASRAFSYIGSCSLIILIFHSPIQDHSFNFISTLFEGNIFIPVTLSFIMAIVVPLFLYNIIRNVNIFALFFFPLKTNPLFKKEARA